MTLYVSTCPKMLWLLGGFYAETPGQPPPEVEVVGPAGVPQPYHGLLVHSRDMTSTLSGFHGEEIVLRVLDRAVTADSLSRHIVLDTATTNRPVEYGAIRIDLNALDEETRRKVVEGQVPLGGILNAHSVRYDSCPRSFFRVRPNDVMREVFGLDEPQRLYGRCNCLTDAAGRTIAEVVEILPPETNGETGLS